MNEHDAPLTADELRDLDLLVDGELDLASSRDLIASLQRVPDGWRQCALAFLEAQAWNKELSGVPDAVSEPAAATAAAVSTALRSRRSRHTTLFAVAASFLTAFTLGLAIRNGLPGAGNVEIAADRSSNQVAGADAPDVPAAPTDRDALATAEAAHDPTAAADEPLDWREIRLVEGGNADFDWDNERESVVPPHIRRALERLGHRVEERHELLPIEFGDGTRGYIPAERVELHYIGNQYQ